MGSRFEWTRFRGPERDGKTVGCDTTTSMSTTLLTKIGWLKVVCKPATAHQGAESHHRDHASSKENSESTLRHVDRDDDDEVESRSGDGDDDISMMMSDRPASNRREVSPAAVRAAAFLQTRGPHPSGIREKRRGPRKREYKGVRQDNEDTIGSDEEAGAEAASHCLQTASRKLVETCTSRSGLRMHRFVESIELFTVGRGAHVLACHRQLRHQSVLFLFPRHRKPMSAHQAAGET
eukprot:2473077-Rhodomonas_salina.4